MEDAHRRCQSTKSEFYVEEWHQSVKRMKVLVWKSKMWSKVNSRFELRISSFNFEFRDRGSSSRLIRKCASCKGRSYDQRVGHATLKER